MNYITKQCPVCHKVFQVSKKHPNTKTCGPRCGGKLHYPARNPIKREDGDGYDLPLTRGFCTQIDEIDIDLASNRWGVWTRGDEGPYAIRSIHPSKDVFTTEKLHRVILSRKLGRPLLPEEEVDHVDTNGLNNRRSNLRIATSAQNKWNQRKSAANRSGFKGVSWCKARKRWRATVRINGKQEHLGYFPSAEIAHAKYVARIREARGEFCNDGTGNLS